MASGNARVIKSSAGSATEDSFLIGIEKGMNLQPIAKAEGQTSQQEGSQDVRSAFTDYITPIYSPVSLRTMVAHSTILPQCIRAYKDNIAGFGYTIEFWNADSERDETPEQTREKLFMDDLLEFFSLDMPLKKLLGKLIEDREAVGVGYLEIERDGKGLPVHGYYVIPETMEISKLGDPQQITVARSGKTFPMRKRFRTFRQKVNAIGGAQEVFFKEFGDPRIMDQRTGKYLPQGETLEDQFTANEILTFTVGNGIYGTVRWLGQSIHIEGSRLAENLNFNYFIKGRHTNLAIIIEGGTLTEDAYANLQDYVTSVQGVDNAHKMLLIEIDSIKSDSNTLLDDDGKKTKPTVKFEHLNDLLQGDALFQKYMDESRRKTQSAFNLPDLYVGYTTDFNRATAEAAIEVTERQVFGPERNDLEWTINNVLFSPYLFKEAYFKLNGPTLSDQSYVIETFKAATEAGGITPDDARKFANKVFDIELKPFDNEWSATPLAIQQLQSAAASNIMGTGTATDAEGNSKEVVAVNAEIMKSVKSADEFIAVLKEVKKELHRMREEHA